MRVGDVSVRLVPVGGGEMVAGEDGRVLARPRQVHAAHLANHSDRRAVARVSVDGRTVPVGPLEETATRVVLRIVIGRPEAFGRARPLPGGRERPVPPRPAPRP